jgi:virginiamycin B lyase
VESRGSGHSGTDGTDEKFDVLLRRHRKDAGLTQERLGELAGVSYQTISNIERGLGHQPRPSTVRSLATALGLDSGARAVFEAAAMRWSDGRESRIGALPTNGSRALNAAALVRQEVADEPSRSAGAPGRRWQAAIAVALVVAVGGVTWAITSRSTANPLILTSLGTVDSHPALITQGPNGTLWFTDQYGDTIWKVPKGGVPAPVWHLAQGSHPFGIVTAPDGGIWFTEGEPDGTSGDAVARLDPGGTLTHLTSLPKGSQPIGIVIAPDGKIWVTAYGGKAVYWISPDGQQIGGPFPVNGHPNRIVVGPDNNLWVTIATSPKVVVFSSDGTMVRDYLVAPNPTDIVVARDMKVWVTSHDSNSLQWIDSVTGQVSEPREVLGGPGALVIGPDGNFWFTQLSGRAISAVSPTGDIVRTVPVTAGTPFGISNGPDGQIWFTVQGVSAARPDAIGRIAVRR